MELYKKLVNGLGQVGDALVEIGQTEDDKPVKLLVAQLANKLNLGDPNVGELMAMLRFVVENNDPNLTKLTKQMTKPANNAPTKPMSQS